MASDFQPKLSVLQKQQVRLWSELIDVPGSFTLCGGTAVALHLGHRHSIDFDFLSSEQFDPDQLYNETPFLNGSQTLQKSANTLTCLVDRGGLVQLSFFGVPSLRLIEPPHVAPDNRLQVASLLDLAGMKAAVVQKRAEAKDYVDLDAIIQHGGISLPLALAAGKAIYGSAFNPELTLKSLCYFGDGNLNTLPRQIQDRLAEAVKSVDLGSLPEVSARRS